jgi:hypothetical protein
LGVTLNSPGKQTLKIAQWFQLCPVNYMSDFKFYFDFGWHHIINREALDHLLFILVLAAIYVIKDWKQVLILVTAFTIGHSLTLALSSLKIVSFPSNWVEFLIPCTIIITAISNLFQKKFTPKSIRINYFLALFFGLIHGMGFANTLIWMKAKDQSFVTSLLGFNLGIEAAQIMVVSSILFVSWVFLGLVKINRREWVIFLSAGAFSIALKMALDRISSL